MKKGLIVIIVLAVIVFAAVRWGISVNNKMVEMDEGVSSAWSQVENVYQRRADLIPNLVNSRNRSQGKSYRCNCRPY